MVTDLLAQHTLKGKSAEEIEALLGPLRHGWQNDSGFTYVYWIERPSRAGFVEEASERAAPPELRGAPVSGGRTETALPDRPPCAYRKPCTCPETRFLTR